MKKIEIKSPHVNFRVHCSNNNLCDDIIKIFEENKNFNKKGKTLLRTKDSLANRPHNNP